VEYDKGEKVFRCKLASLYRLIDLFGWSHGIDSYVTGRISQDFEHFLIAPYGMLHHEVTASSLVKVDMRGDVLDGGASGVGLGVNKVGFSLHAAIYATRPDIKCIVHIRCTSAVAVSALQCGLLALCPETMAVGDISYYEYVGAVMDSDRRDKLRRALGPTNKVLVLRNFGLIVGGETVEEAFWLARNVMTGIDIQLHSIAGGIENIKLPSDDEKRKAFDTARQLTISEDGKKWRLGEQDFEALMKHLDNVGYRTGYIYREPGVQQLDESKQANSEVVVPPTASSYTYSFEDDAGKQSSPAKVKLVGMQQKVHKSDWLGHAKKDELDETTASVLNTTKASKWVPEDTSTPIKPDSQAPTRRSVGEMKPHLETFENTLDVDRSQAVAVEPEEPARKPIHNGGDGPQTPSSPQKSISSVEGLQDDHEVSKENTLERESSKKKKKGLGFHIPSFGSKKKEK
jgi:adducin